MNLFSSHKHRIEILKPMLPLQYFLTVRRRLKAENIATYFDGAQAMCCDPSTERPFRDAIIERLVIEELCTVLGTVLYQPEFSWA